MAVETDYQHNLALRADGTVVAWGSPIAGRTNVPAGLTNVVAIAAGSDHSLALVGKGLPVLNAPAINPTWDGGRFSVSLASQAGHVFALEYKDSLWDTNWAALPLAAGNGGNLRLTDPSAMSAQRYYRVRRW